jgi:hypothetical protein
MSRNQSKIPIWRKRISNGFYSWARNSAFLIFWHQGPARCETIVNKWNELNSAMVGNQSRLLRPGTPKKRSFAWKLFQEERNTGNLGSQYAAMRLPPRARTGVTLFVNTFLRLFQPPRANLIVNRLKQILLAQPRAQLVQDWVLQIPRAKTISFSFSFCLSRRPNLSTTGFSNFSMFLSQPRTNTGLRLVFCFCLPMKKRETTKKELSNTLTKISRCKTWRQTTVIHDY